MKHKKVYIKEWLEMKPYDRETATDIYYLKIANKIKKALFFPNLELEEKFGNNGIDMIVCFLTSYFEDIISETNLWQSFVNLHSKIYSKKLPFYDITDYDEGEINLQDVKFLIWYFVNIFESDSFSSPFSSPIDQIAKVAMDIFEEEYETAPQNAQLKSCYQIADNESNYYVVRDLIDKVVLQSYLFYPNMTLGLAEQQQEAAENTEDRNMLYAMFIMNMENYFHEKGTALLALTAKEWVIELLGENHSVSSDLKKMSQKVEGFFLYKGQDEDNIFLEYIATGRKFNLTKKSYEQYTRLKEVDEMIFLGLIRWQNEWHFSGANMIIPFNSDLVLDERNSIKSRMKVSFLDEQEKKVDMAEILEKQRNAFLAFTNGTPIVFLPTNKVDVFHKAYIKYYNNSLNISEKESKEADKRARKEGFLNRLDNEDALDFFDFNEVMNLESPLDVESSLVFFNPKRGVEIAERINSVFPLKNNPFSDLEDSDEIVLELFADKTLSTELAMYCVENCHEQLPFFQDEDGQKLLKGNDIDFLLRFWKEEEYHTTSATTTV